MNKLGLLCFAFVLLLLPFTLVGQVTYGFLQFGDPEANNRGSCMWPDEDGNILFVGTTSNNENNSDDVYVTKINTSGLQQWNYTYGNGNNEFVNNCVDFDNRYLIICGSITDSLSGTTNGLLIKIDTAGNLIWQQEFGDILSNEDFIGISILANDNIAVTGFKSADVGLGNDVLTVVFNQAGAVQNSFVFGTTTNDYGMAILETPGGDLIISGDRAIDAALYNPFMARTSVLGTIQFDTIYNLPENSGCKAMHYNQIGNIIISGETATPVEAVFDILLMEVDTTGDLIFATNIPGIGPEAGYDIATAGDTAYIITGFGYNPESDENDIIAVHTDLFGNVLNRKFYGAFGADLAYDIKVDSAGNFWLAGFTTVDEAVLFALIYDSFNNPVHVNSNANSPLISISPQPASDWFLIKANTLFHQIDILNMSGAIVSSKLFPATTQHQLNVNLIPGIYSIKLYHQQQSSSTVLLIH